MNWLSVGLLLVLMLRIRSRSQVAAYVTPPLCPQLGNFLEEKHVFLPFRQIEVNS